MTKRTPSQTGRYSRNKGNDFERWTARRFTKAGFPARRVQQRRGSKDSFDVEVDVGPVQRIECKCTAGGLSLHKVLQQSLDEAEGEPIAVVWKRTVKGRTPPHPVAVVMELEQFLDLLDDHRKGWTR